MDTPAAPQKPSKLSALRAFINRHRIASLIVSGALAIAIVGNVALALLGAPVPKFIADILVKPKPQVYYSALTGLPVKDKSALSKPVTGIMLENSPDARPQSGLKDGEVIYEAVAEGGITRFLVMYQQNKPQLIGPVRSVRMYYIDWFAPWNASMAHVGGSATALKQIRSGKYRDLDQFFNGNSYWRVSDRYAPHNVYTRFKNLDTLNKAKGYTSSKPRPFDRVDEKPLEKPTARSISVHISGPLYDSSYRYDPAKNNYTRSQAGAPHKDREKGTLTPKVVVVLKVKETTRFEDTYRQVINTTGKGTAYIFQNGTAGTVTWNKDSQNGQLYFTDKKGKRIQLVRGQTWITAIPEDKGSVSWQK